ncbi:hypothetical protein RhiirA1_454138, partial [Rhizophagus irregularis]
IPLLWEDPFSIPTQHYHCIETYLCFLNEDSKAKFNEYLIIDNLLLSNSTLLFNYPNFIKYLDTSKICQSIKYWVDTLVDIYNNELGNLVYRSLFEVFIESEGNLLSFEVVMITDYGCDGYFNDNIDLILQNPKLTYNIRNLNFDHYAISPQNTISFLKFLYSNCNSISSIIFFFPTYGIGHSLSLIENCLTQIIISQHNLKKISFGYYINPHDSLLSLKNSNCSNTLNTIIFCFIDFKNIINILQEAFDQLNVLESIHILYCDSLNSDFKYIMKKEKVKYLAILESGSDDDKFDDELFFLKDEVNEFKSHNIIVQKYNDLCILAYDYINNHL